MCGIAGFTRSKPTDVDASSLLERMGHAIRHRGPDSAGQYLDDHVGLCHQRLSIIDLSSSGHQPMTSPSDRYVIVYNGEIYNFQELRADLIAEGMSFRGTSDTEVLLALYEQKGEDCLQMLNGMFALAIWDKRDKSLFLARDRLGKKPLYYYSHNGAFSFASEIKSILCQADIERSLRSDAIQDYFNYHYIPDPKTVFEHIHKLEPGHLLHVRGGKISIRQYWDVSFAQRSSQSPEQLQEELHTLLEDSTRIRMISDVPLGAFLSGGVDSSAVVAFMAQSSAKPITTCSIGFDSKKYDEVDFARKVAEQFGTEHVELTVRENVPDRLLEIARQFDEPFADSSFVPTYFVSQLARQRVTVALAGDGGDENFAGYRKYITDQFENRLRGYIPGVLRRHAFPMAAALFAGLDYRNAQRVGSLLKTLSVDAGTGFSISNSFFRNALWKKAALPSFQTSLSGYDSASHTTDFYHKADTDDHLSRILYTDIKTYLPGDILVKVDRMSMANSLETRAPILDYRVVELAATIPSQLKIQGKEGKYVLKKCLEDTLTQETLYRKKMGFVVPMRQWLRSEIRDIVSAHLFRPGCGLANYFDMNVVKSVWDQHQSGSIDYSQELWSMFMFEVWWQEYIDA